MFALLRQCNYACLTEKENPELHALFKQIDVCCHESSCCK